MQHFQDEELFWSVYRDMYLQTLETRNSSDVHFHNTRRTLDRFTRYCHCATKRLSEITDYDLEEYLRLRKKDTWRGKPIKNVSLNNEIKMLNTCFAKAGPKEARGPGRANYGFVEHPPFINKLTEEEPEPHVVTKEQIEKFSIAASFAKTPNIPDCSPAQFWRAALLLAIVTGLRRSSLLKIERPSDEVLIEQRELLLPASIHKTKNYLRIPLGSSEVVEFLLQLPTVEGEPILPWKNSRTGEPLSLGHFSNTMARIQREAGISDEDRIVTKHLRSTAGTIICEEFNDDTARKRLGHSPTSKTFVKHYKAKRISQKDREASEVLGNYVLPHVTKPNLSLFGA
ncbi:tyrosine-type recombinase/integrase [Gimesia aquarii]|uniref:Phage integrase family protein n=1 Tax=Gimesia aquarii TaxID=2527964 RepID=A0A517W3N3_9PLAN|nr:tyrosine-type recombinase/integrase [Gimesia aquarii]QDT99864.1 Phage integrase family protein [Gimesia aquarii]